MTDNGDVMEQLKIIIDNMATKDDLQELEDRLEKRMDSMERRLDGRIDSVETHMKSFEYGLKSLEDSAISKILTHDDIEMITDRAANKALAVVENTLIPRIDALNDGFKLNREKQREMEARVDILEEDVTDIRTQIA